MGSEECVVVCHFLPQGEAKAKLAVRGDFFFFVCLINWFCTSCGRMFDFISVVIQAFPNNQSLDCTNLECGKSILHTVAILARILRDFFEKLGNELLLLNELDTCQNLRRKLDGLIETVFSTVRNVHDFEDDCFQTRVKHITLGEVCFEVG